MKKPLDPKIVKLKKIKDKRGFFQEVFNKVFLKKHLGFEFKVKQMNISQSNEGVIRGIHYQISKPQSKLVYVLKGQIFDIVVDLRIKSPNYGKYKTYYLNEKNNSMLFVPKGFAHGFMTLKNHTTVCYFVDEFWYKKYERTLIWNDKEINVKWPKKKSPLLSKKDSQAMTFRKIKN